MKAFVKRHQDALFAVVLLLLFLLGLFLLVSMQDTKGRKKAPEAPTATPEPTPTEAIKIIFVDDLPQAVLADPTDTPAPTENAYFPETCTIAPTQTPLPTPTATQKPTSTPKPTNTPAPTKKPTAAPKPTYSEGKAGTYKVEEGAHDWKPYARYTAITNKSSRQYQLQQIAKTDENGLRYVTDADGVKRYCVALGVAWAGGKPSDIGRCFDVKMKNGAVLHCVLGDVKKIEHSEGSAGRFGSNGELLEFQVDLQKLPENVKKSGDVSKLGGAFEGNAATITVYNKNVLGG